MNQITICGRLGGDPEIRFTPGGDAVANFSVATSERWTDNAGQKQERTTWFRCVAWGKLAELVAEHTTKGMELLISGSMQCRDWEDRDGQKRQSWELKARDVHWFMTKDAHAQQQAQRQQNGNGYGQQQSRGGSRNQRPQAQPHAGYGYQPQGGGGPDVGEDPSGYGYADPNDDIPF